LTVPVAQPTVPSAPKEHEVPWEFATSAYTANLLPNVALAVLLNEAAPVDEYEM
jgi:hypothetical protein